MNGKNQKKMTCQVACAVGALDEFYSVFSRTEMMTRRKERFLWKIRERANAYACDYLAAAYGQKEEVKE